MPNFITDNNDLNFPKVDRRAIPPGESETKFISAADWNELCQALHDVRDAIQEGTGRSTGSDQWGAGTNMPAGYIHNYADASLAANAIVVWKGADNQATWITGIDATGINEGAVRLFLNRPNDGMQDCGQVVLKDESSTEAASSTATNRIMCPGRHDYVLPNGGAAILVRAKNRDGNLRWAIVSENGWIKHAHIQSLQFYPNLQVGTALSPLSGTYNNWSPTGEPYGPPGEGLGGSDCTFRNHTFIRCLVDAAGATITGMAHSGTGIPVDPTQFGAVKLIVNYGPGNLTISHLGAGSTADNRILCPGSQDLVLPAYGAAWMIQAYPNTPDSPTQWRVIAAAQNAEVVSSLTTTGRVTAKSLSLSPQLSPAALAAGLTSNWNPGSNTIVRVTTTSPASYLDGLVPATPLVGETRILRNVGAYPLVLFPESSSASTATNRFSLPQATVSGAALPSPIVVPANGFVMLDYDTTLGRWYVHGAEAVRPIVNTGQTIKPAALAGADVNNYNPTDAVSGLPGRFASWWLIQGAVGTNLTGIEVAPAGLPPFRHGDRLLLTNMSSGMTVKHFSANSSAGNRILISGGDLVLSQYGSVELVLSNDGGSTVWFAVKP